MDPRNAPRSRRPLYIAVAAIVAGAGLIAAGLYFGRTSSRSSAFSAAADGSPSPAAVGASPGAAGSHQATSTVQQSPPPPNGPPPVRLDGTGNGTTSSFDVIGGLTVFRAHCSCIGAFAVELVDAQGATKETLFNASGGRFDASLGKRVAAGRYTLKVSADRRWTINVAQPRDTHAPSLPRHYGGPGQMFVGPFMAGSSVRLQATNKGSGNFVVEILSADGRTQDVAFNKVGDFSGSTVASGLSGAPYYLNVTSDGTWSIDVSAP